MYLIFHHKYFSGKQSNTNEHSKKNDNYLLQNNTVQYFLAVDLKTT